MSFRRSLAKGLIMWASWAMLWVLLFSYPTMAQGAITATLVEPPLRNLLRNGDFDGDEFWVLKQSRLLTGEGMTRNDAVLLYGDRPGAELVQTVGPLLEPGVRYTLSAWVRANKPGSVAIMGARWVGGHPRVFRGVEPEDGWVKIEFRFEAPSEPGWRQVVLTGTGELIWDRVALHEADTLEARIAREWESRLSSPNPIYTGLVVNARGTNLQRGMSPKIYDPSGQLIFAGMDAGDAQLIRQGLVAYTSDLQEATSHPRLNVSDVYPIRLPLVVDAQDTRGMPITDVVVGEADAKKIRQAVESYDFLGRFAVVFVLEPFSGLSTP